MIYYSQNVLILILRWNAMPEEDRKKLLNKPGQWKKKDPNEEKDKKRRKKRN